MVSRVIIAGLLAVLVCPAALQAAPADSAGAQDKVTVQFRDAPIRHVLDTLFEIADRSYILEPGVTETVTVSIKDTPFETALRSILKTHGLTCNRDGGVYMVQRQKPLAVQSGPDWEDIPTPTVENTPVIEKITLNHITVQDLMPILGLQSPQTQQQPGTQFAPGGWGLGNTSIYPMGGGYGNGYGNGNRGYGYGQPGYGQNYGNGYQGHGYGNGYRGGYPGGGYSGGGYGGYRR